MNECKLPYCFADGPDVEDISGRPDPVGRDICDQNIFQHGIDAGFDNNVRVVLIVLCIIFLVTIKDLCYGKQTLYLRMDKFVWFVIVS